MAREADFYTAEEAAKVLGIPVRRVFGMLCGGELEGHQDEWARWLVPASAVQEARQSLGPSDPDGVPKNGAQPHAAAEAETRVLDAAETAVLSGDKPLLGPSFDTDPPGGEETTQEADEAPLDGSAAPRTRTGGDDAETTEKPPLGERSGAASDADPDKTIREITERLAAAAAKTRELRERLELAEATEATLRENLERERRREAEREGAQTEQHGVADEHPQEEPAAWRNEGFWRGLFGG